MTDEFRLARADVLDAVFALSALAFQRGTLADWAADCDTIDTDPLPNGHDRVGGRPGLHHSCPQGGVDAYVRVS
jgi:hypothetical protein